MGGSAWLPLAGVRVYVWHCDALGVYSGVVDNTVPGGTVGQKFLRRYQLTDEAGVARFLTIYPGWYAGRAVHIHFKIRTTATTGEAYEFTSQQPYASKGQGRMRNRADSIYRSGGECPNSIWSGSHCGAGLPRAHGSRPTHARHVACTQIC